MNKELFRSGIASFAMGASLAFTFMRKPENIIPCIIMFILSSAILWINYPKVVVKNNTRLFWFTYNMFALAVFSIDTLRPGVSVAWDIFFALWSAWNIIIEYKRMNTEIAPGTKGQDNDVK